MKLSILIRTIVGREAQFETLYKSLWWQNYNADIEIIVEKDNKELSVGAKAQKLIERANGDYVVFIDDDDAVSNDYIESILEAIKEDPDCIGFKIECNMEGKNEIAIASNRYNDWFENIDGFKYARTIYHKTPVKREIAIKIGFKDMRYGEDHDYSKRLKESGLLKNEVFIDKFLYFYNYKFENPKTKYGITH